jgi:hypothetical protein
LVVCRFAFDLHYIMPRFRHLASLTNVWFGQLHPANRLNSLEPKQRQRDADRLVRAAFATVPDLRIRRFERPVATSWAGQALQIITDRSPAR